MLVAQSCPTLCSPVSCRPPGSSVHGILQARIHWSGWPFLLREIFLTLRLNPGLPQAVSLPPEPLRKPGTHSEHRQLSLPSPQKPSERQRPCSHFCDGETESQVPQEALGGGGLECRLPPLRRSPSGGTWPSWTLVSRTWERPAGAGLLQPSSAPPIPTPSISLEG